MERLWFISNARSGSTSDEKCEAVLAICREKGLHIVGHTRFPDDALPDQAALEQVEADTILLFAGDGTINAALSSLTNWHGSILILPGGTMNMLSKSLHGDADAADIVHAAHIHPRTTSLPFVMGGDYKAFVAIILGPVGSWADVREAARDRKASRLLRLALSAWRRTFGEKIFVSGVPGLTRGHQAIFVTPADGQCDVAAVAARDWSMIAELGWKWLRGDWIAAQAVTCRRVPRFTIAGRKSAMALFDGERRHLAPGAAISAGRSADIFLTTTEGEQ